jgi:putative membrane protein insertion efficiency factor
MNFIIKNINKFLYKILYNIILFYQYIVSPIMPARCRYYPTCSNYGKQALAWHGVWFGSWLLIKRIGSCHPLGGHGIDFVPLPLASYSYQYLTVNRAALNEGISVYRDRTGYVARLNHLMSSH